MEERNMSGPRRCLKTRVFLRALTWTTVVLVSLADLATAKTCAYAIFTENHSMCKPKGQCQPHRTGVTEEEKETILKVHNDLRLKVAVGNEIRGDPGPQPSGSNIRELVWNDELAAVAQAWANTCPNGHDCADCRKILGKNHNVGQNIYYSFSFTADEVWKYGITAWYDEVKGMDSAMVKSFSGGKGPVVGHYTQLVWAKTKEIGCGAIYYKCKKSGYDFTSCKTYVCNYAPAGNLLGANVYKEGTAASTCSDGPSTKYVGLCE